LCRYNGFSSKTLCSKITAYFLSKPEKNMKTASWVIVENATGNAIFETFNPAIADKINRDKYSAVPILQYLQALNKSLKGQK